MKRQACMITLGAVLALAIPAPELSAQNADPVNGTWNLNLAKSKFSGSPPQSETRTYEVSGDAVKTSTDRVDSQGKPVHTESAPKYDGKDYPITGNPDADTVAVTRVDAYSTRSTLKKAGQPVLRTTRSVANDGKTMTITVNGTNAKGEKIDNVLVFDKQ
jgi:hypothetical protein